MKKNLIALAVLGALSSTAAHAVSVNPDGLGQVLLYPYYTTQGGFSTNVHVVNTTDAVKAVKVRFLEAKNSQEVLDFNLYLSPHDEWTGAVIRTAEGAMLKTADTSCTVPAIPAAGVDFRAIQYAGDSDKSLGRTREGYLEVIEMAVVTNATMAANITHVDGKPKNCGAVVAAWAPGGTGASAFGDEVPTGGLYGYATILDVVGGIDVSADAKALDAFTDISLHNNPGNVLPSLEQAVPVSDLFNGTNVVHDEFINGIDAVSAVIMHDAIMNDYVTDAAINAETDWVVNFPTKRFYVNGALRAPFVKIWDPKTSKSCQPIGFSFWNREEKAPVGDVDFSPMPEGETASLCYEANVVSFNDTSLFASETVRYVANLGAGFNQGWARMDFNDVGMTLVSLAPDAATLAPIDTGTGTGPGSDMHRSHTYHGLPVIGFAAIGFTNGNVGGLLSNYAGLTNHKGTRNIVRTPKAM